MKKVIYTVIVGNYDALLEQPQFEGWDYVCFSDKEKIGWRSELGLSCWKIIPFKNEGYDNTRYSRMPKLLPHRYLGAYDYSVYIDGNAILKAPPLDRLLEKLDWPDFGVGKHRFRDNVYEEFNVCRKLGMDRDETFEAQRTKYLKAGLPNPSQLTENNFLLRRHNSEAVKSLSEAWWSEMLMHTKRDQLCLPYVCWKTGFEPTLIEQDLKHEYFKTKSHYRTMMHRLKRSIKKRLG